MAAGLTLVLGIMNIVNLAHGSLYMVGAYLAVAGSQWTGSYLLGVLLAGLAGTLVVGMLVEVIALRTALRARPPRPGARHLRPDPVLQRAGGDPLGPRFALSHRCRRTCRGTSSCSPASRYPVYRAVVIGVGCWWRSLLWYVVTRTRLGMLIRAGASNRTMVAALGVNIRLLYTVVFGFGAALAGLAGLMAGPIYSVQPGMGELILIQVFVVIVIGGIGSIRGALVGALIVGIVDTHRARVPQAAARAPCSRPPRQTPPARRSPRC